ncbi:unnamed protein product [Lactuca saligna]|uniref:DC1 domain-containing protein n=1 Tax=Lactuca saligna TaxID=75948 RepID=A0AA35ZTT9_LACSI|nr:unnamed protein product [Lactuca saligna]
MKEGFLGACERCGEEINRYHRYYYKCIMAMEGSSSCDDFSLHKFCAELPKRVCDRPFYDTHDMENLWIYKCDKCMYYVHLDCAASRRESFMSIFLSAGLGKTIKNYEDIDHPSLVHLVFPDESYTLPKHLFFQQSSDQKHHTVDYLKHMSHQHPLILVDQTQRNSSKIKDSLLLMCHNPMKKTQLLCN